MRNVISGEVSNCGLVVIRCFACFVAAMMCNESSVYSQEGKNEGQNVGNTENNKRNEPKSLSDNLPLDPVELETLNGLKKSQTIKYNLKKINFSKKTVELIEGYEEKIGTLKNVKYDIDKLNEFYKVVRARIAELPTLKQGVDADKTAGYNKYGEKSGVGIGDQAFASDFNSRVNGENTDIMEKVLEYKNAADAYMFLSEYQDMIILSRTKSATSTLFANWSEHNGRIYFKTPLVASNEKIKAERQMVGAKKAIIHLYDYIKNENKEIELYTSLRDRHLRSLANSNQPGANGNFPAAGSFPMPGGYPMPGGGPIPGGFPMPGGFPKPGGQGPNNQEPNP